MSRLIDGGERIFLVLLVAPFLIAFSRSWTMHPYILLLAVSEILAVVLILIRKPGSVQVSAYSTLIAFLGTALPLAVRPRGLAVAPPFITIFLMVLGLAISISAKLALNRSFGLLAANRGVKRGGPYRFVRHPMYLGYIVNQAGFLLSSFTVLTLCIYLILWTCQVLRILDEERVLCADGAYRDFAKRVPRRLVPGF